MPQVRLKPRKARPFYGRHPWVLDAAIAGVTEHPSDGDVVDLVNEHGDFIARGILNSRSRIRVRLYTWREDETLDAQFWRHRLAAAVALRRQLGYFDAEGGCRLVNSEADGLGGLVVDRYGPYLVVHVTALAIERRIDELLPILADLTDARGIIVRADESMAKREGLILPAPTIAEGPGASDAKGGKAVREPLRTWGDVPTEPVFVVDHGLKFGVDLAAGQKTGFYFDQRENRQAAARYCRGRSVLDVCTYTGGFALACAKHGEAKDVTAIDSSSRALTLAQANAELNGITNVKFEQGDCFKTLAGLQGEGRKFGMVILDPPKFASDRRALDDAIRAYERLNTTAVNLLEPGGILVTCSCTGSVTREDFTYIVASAGAKTKRHIQILEMRGASPDHPVSASCLETEYLKCFICRVN